jgi:hypothetical protein
VNNGLSKEENAEAARRNWGLFPVYIQETRRLVLSPQHLNPAPFTTNKPEGCYAQLWESARKGDKLALKAIQLISGAAKR